MIMLSTVLLLAVQLSRVAQGIQLPAGYDTIWTTQSVNSAGSMPVGGGDIGLNVWAEFGELLFYIAKSGGFDENNSLLKLGRVRLSMDPNPFAVDASFEQHLYLNDGYITFRGGNDTLVKIWVDVGSSAIHTEVTSSVQLNLTASFESWRTEGYQMVTIEQQQTSWGVDNVTQIPLPYQYPDTIHYASNGVLSYHHNFDTPLVNFQINQQGLGDSDPDSFFNPMTNNTFGSFMYSPQLEPGSVTHGKYLETNFTSYNLVSSKPSASFKLCIVTAQDQVTDVAAWVSILVSSISSALSRSQSSTIDWWNSFWDRSWIIINPDSGPSDPGFQVGKNYHYFRYFMGCNAHGKYPTRFNGGLFTFDPVLTSSSTPFTPDYRKWSGGTFTAQNQRLLYWPLLKTGDRDIMLQAFDYYQDISPTSRVLGRTYFNLDVGLTSEQIDNTGLPNVYEYDANEYSYDQSRTSLYPDGIDFNDWLSWLSDTANEFADIILQAHIFFDTDIDAWVSFIEYQLAWFDEFYRQRNGLDSNGFLILYPASGAETYKLALNPSSTVSGLRKTIEDLLISNPRYIKGNTTYYKEYMARVPKTPLTQCPGASSRSFKLQPWQGYFSADHHLDLTCIAPAVNYSYTQNTEPTAMYPVFRRRCIYPPGISRADTNHLAWGEYGLGQPSNLSYALHAYFNDSESATFHGTYGWRQDQIWWARMGLTSLATENTISRFSDSTMYRFSAFKGPNYDWSPDINHYGSASIGLQEMLMQTFALNNTQIRLLPAWPADWVGYFKLKAPYMTTVSGNITGTNVENLVVSPSERLADVVYGCN